MSEVHHASDSETIRREQCRRAGKLGGRPANDPRVVIETRTIVEPNTGCWLWTGNTDEQGYGRVKIRNRFVYVHRVSWETHRGPIPIGMCVCHWCDTPPCANPAHLFLGTNADNAADRHKKGRSVLCGARGDRNGMRTHPERVRRGSASLLAKLSSNDVLEIRRRFDEGETRFSLASAFSIHPGTIWKIIKRVRWRSI